MKERNGGPMIRLKSPPMVILCVLMFKFLIFRFLNRSPQRGVEVRGLRAELSRFNCFSPSGVKWADRAGYALPSKLKVNKTARRAWIG